MLSASKDRGEQRYIFYNLLILGHFRESKILSGLLRLISVLQAAQGHI